VAIQDNDGNLDWDETKEIIVDPFVTAITSNTDKPSGGGCDTGAGMFGAVMLFAYLTIVPPMLKRKRI
jgi:hypothetical protein